MDDLMYKALVGGGLLLVWLIKELVMNPDKIGKIVNAVLLIPFSRHSIKYRDPTTHPLFTELKAYRDHKSKLLVFNTPKKQQIWRIYMHHYFRIMYAELLGIAQNPDLNKLDEQQFEHLLSDTFLRAYSDFLQVFIQQVKLPEPVLIKVQRFENREIETFNKVIKVWQNDQRFTDVKNSNQIQFYNILNDLQSRFFSFFNNSQDFFTDLNGLLESEAQIISSSNK